MSVLPLLSNLNVKKKALNRPKLNSILYAGIDWAVQNFSQEFGHTLNLHGDIGRSYLVSVVSNLTMSYIALADML